MTAKITLQFFGATREVTGSCFLITVGASHVLVDCGLIQGAPEDEARNANPFPFDPAQIDAVVLTHSHIDHSGRLPLLAKAGFSGPVFTHHASLDLCEIMLADSGYLNEKEVEWDNRKRQRKHLPLIEPLYTMDDAVAVMAQFDGLAYEEKTEILPGVTLQLRDAGHILGSAIVELWLEHGGVKRKLVFSGDLGHRGAPILRDPQMIEEADLVVMESTYGDRLHRCWDDTWAELEEIVASVRHQKGNIIIPAFTVGRTQELLYAFKRNYEAWDMGRWHIFLDSPMAIKATEVYSKHCDIYDREAASFDKHNGDPFRPANLHISRTAKESMNINLIESGAIVIAGSGMCSGGRIKHHLKHNIWRRNCHIVIVGFQARGTLGRHIVDGVKQITLWGETISVAAQIRTVGGFSAHADCDGLLKWYKHFRDRPKVALVHGEPEAMDPLAQRLSTEQAQAVYRPEFGSMIDLVKLDYHAA